MLINAHTEAYPKLVNSRFAYVAISRARYDVVIFTNDSATIAARLEKKGKRKHCETVANSEALRKLADVHRERRR